MTNSPIWFSSPAMGPDFGDSFVKTSPKQCKQCLLGTFFKVYHCQNDSFSVPMRCKSTCLGEKFRKKLQKHVPMLPWKCDLGEALPKCLCPYGLDIAVWVNPVVKTRFEAISHQICTSTTPTRVPKRAKKPGALDFHIR